MNISELRYDYCNSKLALTNDCSSIACLKILQTHGAKPSVSPHEVPLHTPYGPLIVPFPSVPLQKILSRPVGVKHLPGPSLPKLMAQFDTDVDSGIIRISQFIDRIFPHHSC